MLGSVSPYELLKASRIKSPTFSTDYDQQIIQSASSHGSQTQIPISEAAPSVSPQMQTKLSIPSARTHYIADIQRRHNAAQRRAPFPSQQ